MEIERIKILVSDFVPKVPKEREFCSTKMFLSEHFELSAEKTQREAN